MRRVTIIWASLIALSLSCSRAQVPAFSDRDEKKFASVAGRVTGMGGDPLPKALVSLSKPGQERDNWQALAVATTDASGSFLFAGIPPGTYSVVADHRGYLTGTYGRKRSTQELTGFTPLVLAAGDEVRGINIELIQMSSISGKAVDQDGEPVEKVYAAAVVVTYRFGGRWQQQLANVQTDDRGEFRISGLGPGRVYLQFTPDPTRTIFTQVNGNPAIKTNQTQERDLPTYYPGGTNFSDAVPITLAPGQDVGGIVVQLARSRVYHVRGKVEGALPSGPLRIRISTGDEQGLGGDLALAPVREGKFDVGEIPPGSYTIAAEDDNRKGPVAFALLRVGDHDAELVLTVRPAEALAGTLKIESGASQEHLIAIKGVEIDLETTNRRQWTNPSDDGAFAIADVLPRTYRIAFDHLPEGSYPKSITVGGRNVLGEKLDLSAGVAGASLDVVVSMLSAEIEGNVTVADGETMAGTSIVLIPETDEPESRWKYKVGSVNSNGQYKLNGLAPGTYRLFAVEQIERGAEFDPDWRRLHASRGLKITIEQSDKKQFTLKRISLAQLNEDERNPPQ